MSFSWKRNMPASTIGPSSRFEKPSLVAGRTPRSAVPADTSPVTVSLPPIRHASCAALPVRCRPANPVALQTCGQPHRSPSGANRQSFRLLQFSVGGSHSVKAAGVGPGSHGSRLIQAGTAGPPGLKWKVSFWHCVAAPLRAKEMQSVCTGRWPVRFRSRLLTIWSIPHNPSHLHLPDCFSNGSMT